MKRLLRRSVIRNARLALPARFVIMVGTTWFLLEACRLAFATPLLQQFVQLRPGGVQVLQTGLLCFAAAWLGLIRMAWFHPSLRSSYRNWLKTTCWHVGKPLPLGPVTLTWLDGVPQ